MNGNPQIIDQLNLRLVEENTAINQYKNNRSVFAIWGYSQLVEYIDERIADETKHYGLILDRVRFLGGIPVVGKLNEVLTGGDVVQIHENDHIAELDAISRYNETIKLCSALGDNGTRVMLESILADEEDHARDLEAQLIQLKQMGIQNYLSAKI
jgi:bacterioferritin